MTLPNSVGGNASVSEARAQQLANLSGRVPPLRAPRDATSRECEAWTSSAIGNSAYALTVGRYPDVLITLMAADDLIAATHPKPAILTAPLPGGGGSGGESKGDKNSADKSTQPGNKTTTAVASDRLGPQIRLASLSLEPIPVASRPKLGGTPALGPSNTTPAKPAPGGSANGDSTAVATTQAIVDLQENYFRYGGIAPLVVACIAAGDGSIPGNAPNSVLSVGMCRSFLQKYMDTAVKNFSAPSPGPTRSTRR